MPLHPNLTHSLLVAVGLVVSQLSVHSADPATPEWSQFRGPTGDGHSTATGLPLTVDPDKNVVWKTPIHGRGWSSPIVVGDHVWLTTSKEDGTELSVVCVDKANGKIVHDRVLFRVANPQFCHKFNSYASPTPVAADGRIYVTFGSPGTACLDAKTGATIWERTDLVCNHYRGAGSSPILYENRLILPFDGSDHQFIIAFDIATGNTLWETKRTVDFQDLGADGKPAGEGDFRKAFATPHIVMDGKVPVLISSGAKAHYAYDARSGKELWRFDERDAHSASTRPVILKDSVFIPTGFQRSCILALRIKTGAPATAPELLWRQKKAVPNKPSLTLVDGRIYAINDGGIASCLDPATGDIVWSERIGGNYSASPLAAEGRLYFFSEEGKVTVIEASPTFKKLSESTVPPGFMASPAVSGRALYLRTRTDLLRVEDRLSVAP